MSQLADLLENDHEEIAELLSRLQSLLREADIQLSFEVLDFFWARLAVHIRAEHVGLFPVIQRALLESVGGDDTDPKYVETQSAIRALRDDHNYFMDQLAGAMKTMRSLVLKEGSGESLAEQLEQVAGQIEAVSKRMDKHNEIEEEQIYLWPTQLLSAEDLELLTSELKNQLRNLPPRFSETT
jgi:hypothetical protein